jgi:DNA-binding response OmpR family regulator
MHSSPPPMDLACDGPRARRRHVLLTEGDHELRYLRAQALEDDGYHVTAVVDGAGLVMSMARSELNGTPPALVVWNVGVPAPEVLPILAQLRRRRPGLPVILLTANGSQAALDEVYRVGGAAVLVNPVDLQDLLAAVRSYAPYTPQPRGSE